MIDVMKQIATPYARRVCQWLLLATLFLLSLHLLFQQINLNVFHQQNGYFFELSNRFDLDDEASVPTWFSQLLFLIMGGTAFLGASLERTRIKKGLLSIIAGVAVILSLDEIAALHEQTLQTIHVVFFKDSAPTVLANAWLIILPFILLAVFLLGRQMIRQFPLRMITIMGIGLGIFMTGAVGVDVMTQGIHIPSFTLEFIEQGFLVGLEEGLELSGCIIVLFGIMDYIERTHHKKIAASIKELKK